MKKLYQQSATSPLKYDANLRHRRGSIHDTRTTSIHIKKDPSTDKMHSIDICALQKISCHAYKTTQSKNKNLENKKPLWKKVSVAFELYNIYKNKKW